LNQNLNFLQHTKRKEEKVMDQTNKTGQQKTKKKLKKKKKTKNIKIQQQHQRKY